MKRSRTFGFRVVLRLYLFGRGGSRCLAAAGGSVLASSIARALRTIRVEAMNPANAACHLGRDALLFQAAHPLVEQRRVPLCTFPMGISQERHRQFRICASLAQCALRVGDAQRAQQVFRILLRIGKDHQRFSCQSTSASTNGTLLGPAGRRVRRPAPISICSKGKKQDTPML